METNEQRTEGFVPYGFMGMEDWHTSDIATDNATLATLIDFMRRTFPKMNAAQMKSFLFSAIREIDKIAHI